MTFVNHSLMTLFNYHQYHYHHEELCPCRHEEEYIGNIVFSGSYVTDDFNRSYNILEEERAEICAGAAFEILPVCSATTLDQVETLDHSTCVSSRDAVNEGGVHNSHEKYNDDRT